MLTKEELLSNSSMAKYMKSSSGRQIKGVLTFEEMKQRVMSGSKTVQVFNAVTDVDPIYFYTDDYCMGVNLQEFKDKHMVPSSTVLPHRVKPRKGLETGCVISLEDYELIYCKGKRHIETVEELLEYLNS